MTFTKSVKIYTALILIVLIAIICYFFIFNDKYNEDNIKDARIVAYLELNSYMVKRNLWIYDYKSNPENNYIAEKINDKWEVRGVVNYTESIGYPENDKKLKSDFFIILHIENDRLKLDSINIINVK
jgi:hypothetical protein